MTSASRATTCGPGFRPEHADCTGDRERLRSQELEPGHHRLDDPGRWPELLTGREQRGEFGDVERIAAAELVHPLLGGADFREHLDAASGQWPRPDDRAGYRHADHPHPRESPAALSRTPSAMVTGSAESSAVT